MHGRIARKKQWINDKNKKKRMEWAQNILGKPIFT